MCLRLPKLKGLHLPSALSTQTDLLGGALSKSYFKECRRGKKNFFHEGNISSSSTKPGLSAGACRISSLVWQQQGTTQLQRPPPALQLLALNTQQHDQEGWNHNRIKSSPNNASGYTIGFTKLAKEISVFESFGFPGRLLALCS